MLRAAAARSAVQRTAFVAALRGAPPRCSVARWLHVSPSQLSGREGALAPRAPAPGAIIKTDTGIKVREDVVGALAARRAAVVAEVIVPRKFEEATASKVHSFVYTAAFVVLSGILLIIYRFMDKDVNAQTLEMLESAAALRRSRAAAKKALQAAATEAGALQLAGSGDSSGGSASQLQYFASGPRNAPVIVLLHAEDGETAAVWGHVHAALAGSGVRVVSFHRHTDGPNGSEAVWKDPDLARLKRAPLTLRVRDARAMVEAVNEQWHAAVAASGGKKKKAGAGNAVPTVVLVTQGDGVWGGFGTAASYAADGASKSDSGSSGWRALFGGSSTLPPPQLRCVFASPLLMNRGRHTAWVDAVVGASRQRYEADPTLLERWLAPPAVPEEEAGAASAALSNAALTARVDASSPRRQTMLDVSQRMGWLEGGGSSSSSSNAKGKAPAQGSGSNQDNAAAPPTAPFLPSSPPPPKKRDPMADRLAEDFRRRRAALPVLSDLDKRLLTGLANAAAATEAPPRAVVLVPDPTTLPSFLPVEQRLTQMSWFLTAAHALGLGSLPPAARAPLLAARAEAEPDMLIEMSGGAKRTLVAAKAAEVAKRIGATPSTASDWAGADFLSGALAPAPLPSASGSGNSSGPASASSFASWSQQVGLAAAGGVRLAEDPDTAYFDHAFSRAALVLGLGDAAAALHGPVEKTFTFLTFQKEARAFAARCAVRFVGESKEGEAGSAGSKESGAHHPVGLFSIPLQRPQAIVDAVKAVAEIVE